MVAGSQMWMRPASIGFFGQADGERRDLTSRRRAHKQRPPVQLDQERICEMDRRGRSWRLVLQELGTGEIGCKRDAELFRQGSPIALLVKARRKKLFARGSSPELRELGGRSHDVFRDTAPDEKPNLGT